MAVTWHDINKMTSNTSLSPIVASTNSATYAKYVFRVFDGISVKGSNTYIQIAKNEYVTVDFGAGRKIPFSSIKYDSLGTIATGSNASIDISVSDDGVVFTKIATKDVFHETSSDIIEKQVDFNYTEARYIRITHSPTSELGTLRLYEMYLGYEPPTYKATIELYNANTLAKITTSVSGTLLKNGVTNKTLTFTTGSLLVDNLDNTSTWSVRTSQNTNYNATTAQTFTPAYSNPTVKLYLKPTIKKTFKFFDEHGSPLSGKDIEFKLYKGDSTIPLIDTVITTSTYTTIALHDAVHSYEIKSDGYNVIEGNMPYNDLVENINFTLYIPINRSFILHNGEYKKWNASSGLWEIVSSTLPNQQQFLAEGVEILSSVLDRSDTELKSFNMIENDNFPQELDNIYGTTIDLKKYMDIKSLTVSAVGQLKLCQVDDYENIIDFTSVDDIYDNFNDSVEVLLFTSEINPVLNLEVNYSPIDELEGNFEVVTWTDESQDKAKRTLDMVSIPHPQFLKFQLPIILLSKVGKLDVINGQGGIRFLFSHDNATWYKWSGSDFINVDASTNDLITSNGNTPDEINSISQNDFISKWSHSNFSLGVYLEDSIRDKFTSSLEDLILTENYPSSTSTLSDINLYILNTTARIDLELAGLTLTGSLSDADLTRVQYKVTLNGESFYPSNGEWTALSEPPQNINITMKTSDIKMMDWNTLRVDFRDFFGTEDYWQTTFVGNYASLMFKDTDGNYYSDDVGQVLQYLDFGNIVAGEVTVSHEIILKNQYGYAVKDIEIVPNTSYLPEGVLIEMSKTNDTFIPESDLLYSEGLDDNEELSFFVRMNTDVNSIPNEYNKFDVFVKASRKDV